MTARRLAVLGAGGHAKVVVASALAAGFEVAGIFDDDETRWGSALLGETIEGPLSALDADGIDGAVIAIGDSRSRQRLATETDVAWLTVIHPDASVHSSAKIGAGSVVFAGGVVQPDVRIGAHVIINTGATVDHDSRLGNYAHIAPGAHLAGDVTVGDRCLIGIGSAVLPGVQIGDDTVLGAGSVAIGDLEPGVVAVGVPARPVDR